MENEHEWEKVSDAIGWCDVCKGWEDEDYLKKELENAFSRVCCLELIPEHITGKLVNES